jgi:hypothetical protein
MKKLLTILIKKGTNIFKTYLNHICNIYIITFDSSEAYMEGEST